MTLIFNGTDNSVNNPAIQGGTGGTTTGVYYPSANAIALSTGGVNALTISNTQAATFTSNVSFSSQLSVPAAGIKFSDSTTITSNAPPNVTVYTSGSGTYTTPTGAKYLVVQMVGGGGGGSSGGTTNTTTGGTGGTSTFGASLTAPGGNGAAVNNTSQPSSGSNGTASGGDINNYGGAGVQGVNAYGSIYFAGGSGGSSFFGQGGAGGFGGAGNGGLAYGSGGGGSGVSASPSSTGGGGGAGSYLEKTISSPASTYSYAVGASGTAGAAITGGYTAGAGAGGVIIVTAYFQGFIMRYAIIDGINVINVIDYDTDPGNPPPGFDEPIIAVQSDTAQIGWTYVDGQFIAPTPPAPTPEQLIAQCKATAMGLLSATDWTQAADCPLVNKAEFTAYRATVRALAINPVANPVWPTQPNKQWSS